MDKNKVKTLDKFRLDNRNVRLRDHISQPPDKKTGFGYCTFCMKKMPNALLFGGRCTKCIGKYR